MPLCRSRRITSDHGVSSRRLEESRHHRHLFPVDRNRCAGGLSRPQLAGQVRPAAVHRRRRLRADSALARQPAHPETRRHARLEEHSRRTARVCGHLYAGLERRRPHRAASAFCAVAAGRVPRQPGLADRAQRRWLSQPAAHEREKGRSHAHRLHRRLVDLRDERQSGRDVSGPSRNAAEAAAARRRPRHHELRRPRLFVVSGAAAAQEPRPRFAPGCAADRIRHERLVSKRLSRQGRCPEGRGAVARSGESGRRVERVLRAAQVLRAGAAIPSADHGRFPEGGCERGAVEGRQTGQPGQSGESGEPCKLRRHGAVDARLAARLRPEHSRDGAARRAARAPVWSCSTTNCGPRARIARCSSPSPETSTSRSWTVFGSSRTSARGSNGEWKPGFTSRPLPARQRLPGTAKTSARGNIGRVSRVRGRLSCAAGPVDRRQSPVAGQHRPEHGRHARRRDGRGRACGRSGLELSGDVSGRHAPEIRVHEQRPARTVGRSGRAAHPGAAGWRRHRMAGPSTCRSSRSAGSTCRRTTGTPTPWVTT